MTRASFLKTLLATPLAGWVAQKLPARQAPPALPGKPLHYRVGDDPSGAAKSGDIWLNTQTGTLWFYCNSKWVEAKA